MAEATIRSVTEDRHGFMWFASKDGLNRFDGETIRVYRNVPGDSNSLSHNTVMTLWSDHRGNLWVGTDRGLDRYVESRDAFHRYLYDPSTDEGLSHNLIYTLFEDRQQRLWVGTHHGLNLYDAQRDRFISFQGETNADSTGNLQIRAIHDDRAGNLWVGTQNGALYHFTAHDGHFRRILSADVRAIEEAPDGTLWVGTHDGLLRFDDAGRLVTHHRHDADDPGTLSSNHVDALLLDRQGALWIGTDGGGLSRLDPGSDTFVAIRHRRHDNSSLNGNVVRSLFEDSKGDLWVGLFNAGVSYHNRVTSSFRIYRNLPDDPTSLSHSSVLSFYEDPAGILWLGTEAGLNRFDPTSQTFSAFQHDPADADSLSANAVLAIHPQGDGRLWVGTYNGGLNLFDPATGKARRFLADPGTPGALQNPHVWEISTAADGQVWLATFDGAQRLDPATGHFHHYAHRAGDPTSIPHNIVRHVIRDARDVMWFCTEGGLARYLPESDHFETFSQDDGRPDGLNDTNITTAYEDSQGRFWVGTKIGGLNLFDRDTGRATALREVEGLPNNFINAIAEGEDGKIWVSTNAGLSALDLTDNRFTNFDESDGLRTGQFVRNSVWPSRHGELYFGGYDGFVQFRPSTAGENPHLPRVVLTDVLVFNQSLPITTGEHAALRENITMANEVRLRHDQSVVTFHFAALNYRSPEKNQYAYMLEGFDEDWLPAGTKNYASYTNLDPGDYVFRVRGSNDSERWSPQAAEVALVIEPPLWATWWFRALAVGVGAFVVWMPFYVRERTIRIHNLSLQRDIERRKQAEAALQQSETDLRITLESIGDGVIAIAPEGRILRMNTVAEQITGCPRGEAIGRNINDIVQVFDPETRERLDGVFESARARGQQVTSLTTVLLHSREGGDRKISESCAPINGPDGIVTGYVLVLRDVTEQQAIEARLRQSEKMDAIGKLAGGIAHDFNNMLGGILGSAELLRLCVEDNEEALEYTDIIHSAGTQASELTSKLLAFSRKGIAVAKPLNLHQALEQTVSILERTIDRSITIRTEFEAAHTTVRGDMVQIQNAVFNLGLNARDAMPDGGTLTISTRNLHIAMPDRTPAPVLGQGAQLRGEIEIIQLQVRDTGNGMDEVTRKHIFEPFFTTKTMGKGTGLGLASVYGMVSEHGGSVAVESQPGEGSTFLLNFPVCHDVPPTEEAEPGHVLVRGQGTILLVDDEEVLRATARHMLQRIGYEVILAEDGLDGIEKFKQHKDRIQLVLLDLVMPHCNGLQCLRELRKLAPKLPVVMSSGFTRDERIAEAEAEGIQGLISKPYQAAELSSLLHEVLADGAAEPVAQETR